MIRTQLCDRLGVEHPVINAPMGSGTAGASLAAAVAEAGGLGMIGGTTAFGPEWLREQIRTARRLTARPFGVGFISSYPGLDLSIRVALEEGVKILCHSFADPTPYVEAAHQAGALVINQVQTVAQARTAVQAGVDIIVAQGTEAGGHTGYSGTLPLVPAVVDIAGGVPVVAAGGIADGRGLAAALMLGAEGVWVGSRFVASREAGAGDWEKQRVVQASTDETVLTRVYDLALQSPFPAGIGDRVIRNDFTRQWHDREEAVIERRSQLQSEVLEARQAGNPEIAPVRAGNAVGLIHQVESAGEIVRRMVEEAARLLRERPVQVLR